MMKKDSKNDAGSAPTPLSKNADPQSTDPEVRATPCYHTEARFREKPHCLI